MFSILCLTSVTANCDFLKFKKDSNGIRKLTSLYLLHILFLKQIPMVVHLPLYLKNREIREQQHLVSWPPCYIVCDMEGQGTRGRATDCSV